MAYQVEYLGCLHWRKNVDYLLIAKPVAINHLRIRRDCAKLIYLLYRLLVVLSEGYDLCCFVATGRSMLEICEIGEQGVSFVGSGLLVSFTAESFSKLQLNLQPFQRKLPTAKAACAVSIGRLLSACPYGLAKASGK